MRARGRPCDALRPVDLQLGFTRHAEGSVLCSFGGTKVLCNASVEESLPPFLVGRGRGWVTAEYALLPRATHTRNRREATQGKQGGRTLEIQRLVGRSLRSIVDLKALGERQIIVDCDVLQADGGTRTASITGAFVALCLAVRRMLEQGIVTKDPIKDSVAAVSVGIVRDIPMLDVDYAEDSEADVDLNLVMTGSGTLVEIQGTGEKRPYSQDELSAMLDLGSKGIRELIGIQSAVLCECRE